MEIDERVYRMAKFGGALSNAVRLQLILLLRDGEENVSALSDTLERDRSTISRHLSILSDNNLVQSKTSGRQNFYSIKKPELIEKFLEIRPLLER
jgi:DNA-binding transcriptional ArsR family regulator